MSAHTPGPWEFDVVGREGNPNDPWHCAIVGTAIGRHVVIADTLNCSCVFSPNDQRANARLIAAAPNLLLVAKTMIEAAQIADDLLDEIGKEHNEIKEAIRLAQKFVAEAEGGT